VAKRGTRRSEQLIGAAQLERQLAQDALVSGNHELAWARLLNVLKRLSDESLVREEEALFAESSLAFSNLCLVLGKGFSEAMAFLQTARSIAELAGDRRSRAMIGLHLGQLYFIANRHAEAVAFFAEGKADVEDLGDEDILTQAAEFIGMYSFFQGRFQEALPHFEKAAQRHELGETREVMNPSAPTWLCFCAAYLGQFHKAIGTVDYYRRLALERADTSLASTLTAVLGIVLVVIQKKEEAVSYFTSVLEESPKTNNILARSLAEVGMGYYHFLEGRLESARECFVHVLEEGSASGLMLQYGSDVSLEVLYEAHSQGIEVIPGLDLMHELERAFQGPNVYLRGVALRLKAMDAMDRGEDDDVIRSYLEKSLECLEQSGNPVQLAKTRLEMARLKLPQGDHEGARLLANEAWRGFSGYGDVFYPDDLRHLLKEKGNFLLQGEARERLFDMFMDMIQEMEPGSDLDTLLTRTVAATNRFCGAERGAIFWFEGGKSRKRPELRAACNLSPADVTADAFRPSLELVNRAYGENRPQAVRLEERGLPGSHVRAVLCVPFDHKGRVSGVLYHDYSHLNDCFDYFDPSDLVRISRSLSSYVEKLLSFSRRLKQKASLTLNQLEQTSPSEIITENPDMLRTLDQADRIAATNSTVLILGETGVGKELVARRFHKMSHRRTKPFVIVDLSTIPENLVESELFGHEKGAFTGADRQKPGRLEVAHGGTLFIDEVGEIPKSTQVKLLRVLQEKALTRVGGNRILHSDFRLVAATNRDLAAEVAAGRFREDLYYRLNVVPLIIPPLRERREDIPLLAGHFLHRYATKHNRQGLALTSEDEKKLMAYGWPGNVRELENLMERTVLFSTGVRLDLVLPLEWKAIPGDLFSDDPTLDEIQRRYIRHVLEKTGGKISGSQGAAEILGMKRTSLNYRMKKLGL
jgi:transcriptional regulator with GAF, ATPase, and Fis domain